ncbi:unnamed protein product [Urochloa decumbens]|uniref:F-box domain-containing protein n=1 Tax=Urochloa decumbens TaxID=240449 RepID=A0ABC9FKQ9_9POAL
MAEPGGGRRRGVAWVVPGDGADHITALPLELRARIAASLPFRQVARLATLSRPWRHIHHHAPIVKLNLNLDEWRSAAGVINEDALAGLEVALARRGQEGSGSKVDTLRIAYNVDNPGIRRHAGLIITLAGARKICVTARNVRRCPLEEWTVDLSPAARDLEVNAFCYLAPTVAGPGAAALQTLVLHSVVLRDWPCLPSLRSLTLGRVIFEAPPPLEWCPRLENLRISYPMIHVARVDIRLPLLKSLKMDGVYRTPHADITVDAPELEELHVRKLPGGGGGYKSFTLRAPRLRCLMWREQFVEHVSIDVGRPSSVTSGHIRFTWSGRFTWNRRFGECREMKDFRSQTVQMLEGLLPELPPGCVAHAARPYMSLDKYTVEDPNTSEPIPWEKLTCDLSALMSLLKA